MDRILTEHFYFNDMIQCLLELNKPSACILHLFNMFFQAEEENQNDIEDLTALLNRMGSGKF